MKATPWPLAVCLCLVGIMQAKGAQAAPSDPQDEKLEHILVIDRQESTRNSITEIDLVSFTGFARVIDREKFDHRFVDFNDLLDSLPGIQVKQSSGTGTFSSISVRGSTGKQVNIFLDGLLLNSPNSGSANISQIPSVLIESVEAYPDFTPAQLGNANIAGAINFKSRDLNTAKPGAKLSVARGSFGLQSNEISAWGKVADWDLVGGASRVDATNDFPVEDNAFKTPSTRRLNDSFDQESLFLKAGRHWQASRFSALLQTSDSNKQLPTSLNQLRDSAYATNQSWRLQTVVDYQLGALDVGHRAFVTKEKDHYKDPNSTVGLGVNDVSTTQEGFGLFNTIRHVSDEHERVLSLELRDDDIDQIDKEDPRDKLIGQRKTAVLALADTWSASEEWLLSGTVRQYWVDDEARFPLKSVDASDKINETGINLGSKWSPTSYLTVKSNAGLLVRIPTLAEKFGSRGLFEGNPGLQSENARSIDTGFNLTWPKFHLGASVFYRQVDDAIVTIVDSRGVGKPQNVAQSDIAGLESEGHLQITDWLQFTANATLLDSENHTDSPDVKGKKMPGLYHQSYGVGVIADIGPSRLQLHYQHHNELYYEPANKVEADTKKELNASLTFSWKSVTLDLSANNLLDKNFLDMNYFPTPGRSYVVTLNLTI